jgi:uracil-DNA glycosylase
MDAGEIPSSNIIFVRSKRKATLEHEFNTLVELCWPFHAERIRLLNPKVIVCMGGDAGRVVREKIGARKLTHTLVEQNNRRWTNRLYEAPDGRRVAVLTHPAVADWTASPTDPTDLISTALN